MTSFVENVFWVKNDEYNKNCDGLKNILFR